MAEYIDKEELNKSFDGMTVMVEDCNGLTKKEVQDTAQIMAMLILEQIDELPTIEIVRCKDCRYRNSADLMCANARDDWFCAEGEKR